MRITISDAHDYQTGFEHYSNYQYRDAKLFFIRVVQNTENPDYLCSCLRLLHMYTRGVGAASNKEEASKYQKIIYENEQWFLEEASKDDASRQSQYDVGLLYQYGYITSGSDSQQAQEWYEKVTAGLDIYNINKIDPRQFRAAKMAVVALGHMFKSTNADNDAFDGNHAHLRSDGTSLHWFTKAAQWGDQGAQFYLGLLHLGREILLNPTVERARYYLALAAKQGHQEAGEILASLTPPTSKVRGDADAAFDMQVPIYDYLNNDCIAHEEGGTNPGFRPYTAMSSSLSGRSRTRGYHRQRVPGDGDCGYTAFGIPRKEAQELLKDNRDKVDDLLRPAVRDLLLEAKDFYDFLFEEEYIPKTLSFETMQADPCKWAADPGVIGGFIDFDVRDKRFDNGWAHPATLQALASIKGVDLYIWQLGSDAGLQPNKECHQHLCEGASKRIDLLFTGNHFDRLAFSGGSPAQGEILYPLSAHSMELFGFNPNNKRESESNELSDSTLEHKQQRRKM